AVLRLRLCVRRLPRELALCALRGGSPRRRDEVLRHAEGGGLEAPFRAARTIRPRCAATGVLAEGPRRHRAHDRRARGDGQGGVTRTTAAAHFQSPRASCPGSTHQWADVSNNSQVLTRA